MTHLTAPRVADTLTDLRRACIRLAVIAAPLAVGAFLVREQVLALLLRPLHRPLAFFHVAEAFLVSLRLALFTALVVMMPVIFADMWRLVRSWMPNARALPTPPIVATASALFYGGIAVCYFIVLPNGIRFLVSLPEGQMEPVISAGSYLAFTAAFLFAFGLIFELPLIMLVLAQGGLVTARGLSRFRRYAILINVIVSAILTPTPDVYNLTLMAAPVQVLYELSILLVWLTGRRRPAPTGGGTASPP